jgi:hypothetical protein
MPIASRSVEQTLLSVTEALGRTAARVSRKTDGMNGGLGRPVARANGFP